MTAPYGHTDSPIEAFRQILGRLGEAVLYRITPSRYGEQVNRFLDRALILIRARTWIASIKNIHVRVFHTARHA